MGRRTQACEGVDAADFRSERPDNPDPRRNKPGRRPKPRPRQTNAAELHRSVIRQYFPDFLQWLKAIKDPRKRPDRCTYPIEFIIMTVLLMHCGQCGSRRQLGRELTGGRLGNNIWRMIGKAHYHIACHADTVNEVLEVLDPAQLENLITELFDRLRKMRALDRFRFDGKLTFAIDGTKIFSSHSQHCAQCTHQTQDGKTTYFHNVLAAKIVTPIGLVIPLVFEFIENPDSPYNKQDCELKAWRRLADKIAEKFPRLNLNLVADGLYAEETGMADLESRDWNFLITLSEDKLPTVTAQLPPTTGQWNGSKTRTVSENDKNGKLQRLQRTVRWQTPIKYHGDIYHVVEMEDIDEQGNRVYYNRWITNVKPNESNAFDLARTGRLRWKIENEGTNTQKNGGYEMEHVYGRKKHAWKNYYLLLQISQLLNDLVRFSNLIAKAADSAEATFSEMYGTIRNFARRLIEAFRNGSPDMNGPPALSNIRIRLGPS